MIERILTETGTERFSLFPIKHQDLWNDFYKVQLNAFWTVEEVDLSKDLDDWNNNLNENEKFFIKNVLSFFNQADGIINENLAENFLRDVKYPEAKCFYGIQIAIENIHAEMYSKLIDTYIENENEKRECFYAIDNLPAVKKKADWALKWIENSTFQERLVAFAVVEGIFFSGSFCSIFWLSNRGLMQGLGKANSFINRDENLHCEFAINLINNHIENKPTRERILEIVLDAVDIEKEFIIESLPCDLLGMNKILMTRYIEYVADQMLLKLRCKKHFNSKNPFKFMEGIALNGKQNFFEGRPTEYQKAKLDGEINFNEEF